MDKNMINIDDLVRQRLSGGEERERPGSWLQMRDLLDKEMPVKPVAGYNWRRMLGVMTGLALLSVLTVGGYQIATTRFNNHNEKAVVAANTKTRMSSPYNASSGATASGTSAGTSGNKPGASVSGTSGNDRSSQVVARIDKEKTATRNTTAGKTNKDNKANSTVGNKAGKSHNDEQAVLSSASGPGPLAAAGMENRTEHNIANTTNSAHTNTSSVAQNNAQAVPKNRKTAGQPGNTGNHNNVFAAGTSVPADKNNNSSLAAVPIEPLESLNAAVADNTRLKTPAPQEPDLPKDSMNKLTIVQRSVINPLTRTGRFTTDTISIERMAVDRNVLAQLTASSHVSGKETPGNEEKNALTPVAASAPGSTNAEAGMNEVMVPLSDYKVQSRKTNEWNARSFDEVMRDVKFNLSQVKFYPGVSAGGNSYLFGPNNLGGIQLGLFGLFTFGENLSAMGELKYVHRFNNGSTLKDNYFDVRNAPGNYLQGKVEHFFKFSALQSIEMPLALRYAAGRVNVFGGINFAYNFAVNAEEISVYSSDSSYTPTVDPDWTNSKPTVSYEDFKARFAIGGLAGISYEFTPSVQFDFRATKNFWDNASGTGGTKVSQQLYRAPSFQMSIFYRFNQKNQIPKAK